LFTSFSVTRNAAGIESARPWSILPVSNNIAELPGLGGDWKVVVAVVTVGDIKAKIQEHSKLKQPVNLYRLLSVIAVMKH